MYMWMISGFKRLKIKCRHRQNYDYSITSFVASSVITFSDAPNHVLVIIIIVSHHLFSISLFIQIYSTSKSVLESSSSVSDSVSVSVSLSVSVSCSSELDVCVSSFFFVS